MPPAEEPLPLVTDSHPSWWGADGLKSTPAAKRARAVPLFPSSRRPGRPQKSKLWKDLRPDRDHPHEQGDGCQSRRLFHENPQHRRLHSLEHRENNVPFSFFCKGPRSVPVWKPAPMVNRAITKALWAIHRAAFRPCCFAWRIWRFRRSTDRADRRRNRREGNLAQPIRGPPGCPTGTAAGRSRQI